MTSTHSFLPGTPCWVEALQHDPEAAVAYYGELLGWAFDDAEPNGYRVARLNGRRVAGIGQAPPMLDRGAWMTYVLVSDLDKTLAAVTDTAGAVIAGPLDTADGARTAVFTDPNGAALGVLQSESPRVAEVVDVPGAWQMSALHTPDLAEAERFYAAVCGWRLHTTPGSPISLWRLPDSTRRTADPTLPDDVVAVAAGAGAGVPPHWAVNVQVEDVDATTARAIELGGAALMPPMSTPGFRSAVLADPGGGVLAISQIVGT